MSSNPSESKIQAGEPIIRIQSLNKWYGQFHVLKDIDLEVAKGERIVICGPSGSGKSTTLQMINRLMDPDSGDILVRGSSTKTLDPVQLRRSIGYVIQDAGLFPHWNVERNVGAVLKLCGESESQISKKTRAALEMVQLDPGAFGSRFPDELSGGQRQRVAIGRAIVRDPKAFLFDEPLSNLDAELRVQMRLEIAKLHAQLGATMIYVTHDQVEAMTLATRIVVLRDGRIEQYGTPDELYSDPDPALLPRHRR